MGNMSFPDVQCLQGGTGASASQCQPPEVRGRRKVACWNFGRSRKPSQELNKWVQKNKKKKTGSVRLIAVWKPGLFTVRMQFAV